MTEHELEITQENYMKFRDTILVKLFGEELLQLYDEMYEAGAVEFTLKWKTKE